MAAPSQNHQFLYDEHGRKIAAVIPIDQYNAVFASHLEPDEESKRWLDSDMGEDLPDYDWGRNEPEGTPIQYELGVGFVVLGGKHGG
jgi:hypothetical protein